MKHLMTWAAASVPLLSSSPSFAQSGNMMNGDWWGGSWMGGYGGYGGFWMAVAMIAVVAIVVWAILQSRK